MKTLVRLCAAVIPALALCLALPSTSFLSARAQPVPAGATITVNSTADVVGNDGQCTLREALTAAADDAPSGAASGECAAGSGNDTININVTGTIELTAKLNTMTNVSIVGPGSSQLTLKSVGSPHPVLITYGSSVNVSGVTMTGGVATPADGGAGAWLAAAP